MLSIDNTFNADELREFDGRVRKALGKRAGQVRRRAEDRRRGLSLTYEDGLFDAGRHARRRRSAATTSPHNLKTVRDVPLRLQPTSRRRCSRRAAKST